jgi:hypothetical protein
VKIHQVSGIVAILYFLALKLSKIGFNLANRYPVFAWMKIEVNFTLPTSRKKEREKHVRGEMT